jgi:hypothetical protein
MPLLLVSLICLMWPAVGQMIKRGRRPPSVVLWLRRFHRGAHSRDLLRFWEGAVQPWGQVITLTDADVRRPMTSLILLVILNIVAVPMFLWMISPSLHLSNLAFAVALSSCVSLLVSSPFFFLIMKLSVTNLRYRSQLARILRHTRRIRSQKLLIWSGGSATIQCPPDDDDLWRMAISTLAPEVGAIIVDFGEGLSANMEWEVRELSRVCGPARLIFAISESAASRDHSSVLEQAEVARRQLRLPGKNPRIIIYPLNIPRIAISKRYESVVRPAQRVIGLVSHGVDTKR